MRQKKIVTLSLLLSALFLLFSTIASATEPMVAAGGYHSLALKDDGTVWSWGYNKQGQLGNGSNENSLQPVQVHDIENVVSIAAGYAHSLALNKDGTVWSWGDNDFGQLGDNSDTERDLPVQVQETGGDPLSSVVFIAAGEYHSLALKSDGTVWVWGNNEYGQLGNNSTTRSLQALQLPSLNNIEAIAGGNDHSLALTDTGTVWAWGFNGDEQLGDGTSVDSHVPILVQDGPGGNLTAVTAIGANSYQSFVLLQDTTVKIWGDDIGPVPTTIVDINSNPIQNIKKLGQGRGYHLLAIKTDGTAWAGGGNGYGQLGDDTNTSRLYGVQVRGVNGSFLNPATSIAAGKRHSLAVLSDGKIAAWGDNRRGQLGIGLEQDSSYPVQVLKNDSTPLSSTTRIAAGTNHTTSLLNNSSVQAWGKNDTGSLGNDSVDHSSTATQVLQAGGGSLTGVLEISSGDGFSLALKDDGTVWAWGDNSSGTLGNDSNEDSTVPVQVLCDASNPHPPLANIIAIAAGQAFAMALDQDNRIWTWGDNYSGQLGDGTKTSRNYAHRIALTSVTAIATGNRHALALLSDMKVAAWGENYAGQVGNKNNDDQDEPQGVLGETFPIGLITKISAGGDYSLALRNDGTLFAWGNNGSAELGDGTYTNRNWADHVLADSSTPLTGIKEIGAGRYHALAIKDSLEVIGWGSNYYGNLGDKTTSIHEHPVQIKNEDNSSLDDAASVSAGEDYSVIQKTDGTVWTIGRNDYGQLGNGVKKWVTYEVNNFSVKDFPWAMFLPALVSPKQ